MLEPATSPSHILLFWTHEPEQLTATARQAIDKGRTNGELAIADITHWELALLHERGRLVLPADVSADFYLKQLLASLRLQVLPITPEIALRSRSDLFLHGDPADRLIGATALQLGAPLITADAKLRAVPKLESVWRRTRGAAPRHPSPWCTKP